jgi:hypothetical protein
MRKLVICATAAFAFAALTSAPTLADFNFGAVKNGDSCWKDAASRKGEFGYWDKCPATASTAATTVRHTRTHKRAHS